MRKVAIIPARGGSKRIPKKNIRDFCGQPMIAWSIQAAQASGLFDRIIVSTDSQEIAATARQYGAETPFLRPAELADDMAMTAPVLVHALRWLEMESGLPEVFCCIYPTAPLLGPEPLRRGLELLLNEKAACAFSVAAFDYPIWRGLKVNTENRVAMLWPENENMRSQDLPEAIHDAGQFYWADSERFLAEGRLFADAVPVRLPRHLVQDIDTPEDWTRAEFMFKAMRGAKGTDPRSTASGESGLSADKMKILGRIREHYAGGQNIIEFLKLASNRPSTCPEDIMISYDFQAGSYADAYAVNEDFHLRRGQVFAKIIEGLGEFNSLVEVGLGDGTSLAPLLKNLSQAPQFTFGFDLAWSRVKCAVDFLRRHAPSPVELCVGDLFCTPFADSSVDVVFSSHAIEPNGGREEEALMELHRIARKYLVLVEPAYPFATEEGRERMLRMGYITRLHDAARELGYRIIEHRPLAEIGGNPLNPSGLLIIQKQEADPQPEGLCCPITKSVLRRGPDSWYSEQALLAYPVIQGIPCLLPQNAIVATQYDKTFR